MLDKDLIRYLGDKKKYLIYIVLINTLNLILSVCVTASFVFSIKYFLLNETLNGIYVLLGAFGFGVLKILTTHFSGVLSTKLADFITYKLRKETYTKFLELEGKTPFSTSEMAQLSTEGIEQLRLYYSSYLPSFFYAMIAPILLFILIIFLDWPTALLYIACVPLIPMSIIAVSKWAKKIFNKYWDQYIGLGNSFLDNIKGMKELKIFKYDEKKQKEMEDESEGFRKITMKVLVMQLASVTIMDLVAFGGAGIGILITLLSLTNNATNGLVPMDPFIATFLILIGAEFFLPLRTLGSAFHVAMNGATAGKKIMKLLNEKAPIKGKLELNEINEVKMNKLTFEYDDATSPTLKDINLTFKKGLYSLVGVSGSGKSTIAKLFSKTQDPTSGEILINNKDIKEYSLSSFYKKVCYISNNTYIFHQSILDSFRFYKEDISEDEIHTLLKLVKLDHLDLNYVIEEDVTNLSGGEKQRLALALYLTNTYDFYIFDEVTSNIDIESEEIILDIIKKLSETKIVLMISHRLKSTSLSNEIYYLEDGRIILNGTFDSLLKEENEFKKLYLIQKGMEEVL